MARPKGFRLNRPALSDLLLAKGLSMTVAAERSGVALTTLSGLAGGDHRASIKTARALASGIECEVGSLFPELTRNFAERSPAEAAA